MKKKTKRKKFVIYTGAVWSPNVGGVISLHKLCHDLNTLGEEAYITDVRSHPSFNAPFYEPLRPFAPLTPKEPISFEIDDDTIVVYPAGIYSNPLNAKHIVRWMMHPNRLKELDKYETKGLIVKMHDRPEPYGDKHVAKYLEQRSITSLPILVTGFYDFLTFRNYGMKREGSCFMIRKGVLKERKHPDDALNVEPYCRDWPSLAYIFNQKEYFYCYDTGTATVLLAALCGCIPIIIPCHNNVLSAQNWRKKAVTNKYGMTYGIDDLEHAKNTINEVPEYLKKCNDDFLETVKNFIELCQNEFTK